METLGTTYIHTSGPASAYKLIIISIVGWSIYDMLLSLMAKVHLNIIIDIVVMALLIAPLILTRAYFQTNSNE
jgi:hypothetical protein